MTSKPWREKTWKERREVAFRPRGFVISFVVMLLLAWLCGWP
jgi:hypothetical protein